MRSLWVACALFAGIPLAIADARLDRQRAEAKCAAKDPTCDWLGALSSLERASVTRAIAARGYTIEPAPWGKVIGAVRVYNEDVFAEKFGLLEFFNHFHVTTKEYAIAQEVVIGAGEVWDQARIDETARRLRDPLWTSVVVVIPVKSYAAARFDKVDMLVVTRDIWSLRLNTQYTFQQGSLTNLSIALSENNFLGTRSVFAAGFAMDQGAIATGPIFLDKNLLGLKIDFRARFDFILNRQNVEEKLGFSEGPPTISESDTPGFNREGTQSSFSLNKPLFSLASQWGAGLSFSHRYAIDRRFRGLGLLPVDCSTGECLFPIDGNGRFQSQLDFARNAADAQLIGVQYEMRRWDVTASGIRQWGTKVKQQLSVGYSVDNTDPKLLDSFPGDATERTAFIRDVLPRNEVTSTPFVSYGFFVPRFKTFRNVSTFELAEDARLGPAFDVSYSVGLKLLGSDFNFQRGSWAAAWGFQWCRDGLVRPSIGMSTRYQDNDGDGDREFIDNTATLGIRVVTPTYKWARIVGESTFATRWRDAGNRFFSIGSENGLRGFLINEFSGTRTGDRLFRTQVELRTTPRPLWVLRVGGVVFYEVGGVGDTLAGADKIQLHHDIGVGFRMLIPQTARDLFRFDFAVPLDGNAAGSVRFIAGFESAF
ncbi:MAG: hypothetical protein H0V17_31190 [Deltaproteobacteria bacterium]|nr:hypothetical protein [Deltaproteobacteria bacterium]